MTARFQDFAPNTWVYQKTIKDEKFFDHSKMDMYFQCVYWACQTLTTVGYGDFGAFNSWEIILTIIWMAIGVAFYSIVVGTLTSTITSEDQ